MDKKDFSAAKRAHQIRDQYSTSSIRARCREAFEIAIPNIATTAKGEKPATPFAEVRAFDLLGKYGMGKTDNLLEHGEWITVICRVTSRHLGSEEKYIAWAGELWAALEQEQ